MKAARTLLRAATSGWVRHDVALFARTSRPSKCRGCFDRNSGTRKSDGMASTKWSRRQILKGAGVALSVPWLETFELKRAHAATASVRRYLSVYWPNGTADGYLWGATGAGSSMTLAPILQPLQPNISKIMPLGCVGNYSPWGDHVEPSHGNNCATAWTGVKATKDGTGQFNNSAISIDQAIGNQIVASNNGKLATQVHSLQLGLSTLNSYEDGLPGAHSRSISWKDEKSPLYKIVSPQNAFDTLVAGGLPWQGNSGSTTPDPTAMRRQALKKSALDYIGGSTSSLQLRLSKSDNQRLGAFLSSVRDLEDRVTGMPGMNPGASCGPVARPNQIYGLMNTAAQEANYNRGAHATLMIDLMVMAFQCDLTRVVSFMLDDARSDFVYNFLQTRKFSPTGSTQGTGAVQGYHGLQHQGDMNDGFATITYWNMERLNEMITKISNIQEGGKTAFDSIVIHAMSGMHGGNHDGLNLPVILAGTGGGVLKTGQALNLGNGSSTVTGDKKVPGKNLQDVHVTILNRVFGGNQAQFGTAVGSFAGTTGVLNQLLA
jgi:hypothetical protein